MSGLRHRALALALWLAACGGTPAAAPTPTAAARIPHWKAYQVVDALQYAGCPAGGGNAVAPQGLEGPLARAQEVYRFDILIFGSDCVGCSGYVHAFASPEDMAAASRYAARRQGEADGPHVFSGGNVLLLLDQKVPSEWAACYGKVLEELEAEGKLPWE